MPPAKSCYLPRVQRTGFALLRSARPPLTLTLSRPLAMLFTLQGGDFMDFVYEMDNRPFDIWTEALMTWDFRQYLETVEDFIEGWEQERLKDVDKLPDYVASDLYWEVEGFKQILRHSYFVALCAYLEVRLVRECHYRRGSQDEPLFTPKHQSLKKAMKYLVDRGMEDLRQSKGWNEIVYYWKLRNCIVHNMGEMTGQFDEEGLRAYVKKTQSLSLSVSDEVIILSKRFCQEATDTIDRFLHFVLKACKDLPFFGLTGGSSNSEKSAD